MKDNSRSISNRQLKASLVGLGTFIAALIFYLPLGPQQPSKHPETVEEIRDRTEKRLSALKTYVALKQFYPEDYQRVITIIVEGIRNNRSVMSVNEEELRMMEQIRQREAKTYGNASFETLRADVQKFSETLEYFKAADKTKHCNTTIAYGAPGLYRLMGPDLLKDKTLVRLMDELSESFFRATAEGKQLKTIHEAANDEDWQIATDYLVSKGFSESNLSMLQDLEKHLDNPRLCEVYIQFIRLITTMNNNSAKRLIPQMAITAEEAP